MTTVFILSSTTFLILTTVHILIINQAKLYLGKIESKSPKANFYYKILTTSNFSQYDPVPK